LDAFVWKNQESFRLDIVHENWLVQKTNVKVLEFVLLIIWLVIN
jgi:hypothetical protein